MKRSHSRDDKKSKLEKIREKPGMSNAGKYDKSDAPFAGPHGTYPLGEDGKLSPRRVRAALALAHHSKNPGKIRSKVASILSNRGKMPSLAAKIRKSLKGK